MPIYDFQCDDCGEAFEALVRNDSELRTVTCSKCEGPVRRTISLPAKPVSAGESAPMGGCGVGPPCGAPRCGRLGM